MATANAVDLPSPRQDRELDRPSERSEAASTVPRTAGLLLWPEGSHSDGYSDRASTTYASLRTPERQDLGRDRSAKWKRTGRRNT